MIHWFSSSRFPWIPDKLTTLRKAREDHAAFARAPAPSAARGAGAADPQRCPYPLASSSRPPFAAALRARSSGLGSVGLEDGGDGGVASGQLQRVRRQLGQRLAVPRPGLLYPRTPDDLGLPYFRRKTD